MPNLYLVATPIGNLEDITLRALRILGEVKLIAAEDTRTTRHLLRKYNISTRLISYHEQGKGSDTQPILEYLKENDVALVSEAGMPGLSDPGYRLVAAAVREGIPVVPIPGPSAIVTALAASGLPSNQFLYVGFLPRRKTARRRFLQSIAADPRTIVALESPHRLRAALEDLVEVLGDRGAALARELTKVHEEIYRGRLSQAIEHFAEPRGEFTLVIEGKTEKGRPEIETEAIQELRRRRSDFVGMGAGKAIARVAATSGLRRRDLYRAWLQLQA
ncbi:MAG: 16S rRNA (cytidine(1402)-2'-O)-methyltransferase [Dehalococcoidia bacterium]|nr:16S rRNA (cytidine(1402)-2'-O)-methyltransferase [Dehalococcoidia bacterium]